jgi:hypothetical protein
VGAHREQVRCIVPYQRGVQHGSGQGRGGADVCLGRDDILSSASKEFVFPSGRNVRCQGYEPFAYKHLLRHGTPEEDIVIGRAAVPMVPYVYDRPRKHYPDIYLPLETRLVEVKSEFTFMGDFFKNMLKQSAAESLGYVYDIWVFDRSGKLVCCVSEDGKYDEGNDAHAYMKAMWGAWRAQAEGDDLS